jgi:hypothetical protein
MGFLVSRDHCDFCVHCLICPRLTHIAYCLPLTGQNAAIDFDPGLFLGISAYPGTASHLRSKVDTFQLDE